MKKLKFVVVGHGRHGKDTAAEKLAEALNLKVGPSSLAAAETVFKTLGPKYGYASVEECYADRHNHRAEWFDSIVAINTPNKHELARLVYQTNDIYVGMRDWRELNACKNAGLYDVCIWVDRRQHCPPEPSTSMTVEPWMADYILDNNGTLEDLSHNLDQLIGTIERHHA